MSVTLDPLEQLVEELALYEFDPLGFVRFAYPWGEPGILSEETGPDEWQVSLLKSIGAQLKAGGSAGAIVLEAVRAGHGVGKSALTAWLIDWAMSTHERTRGVVTAMTELQLRTKTWAELSKWHEISVTRPLFSLQATSRTFNDSSLQKVWRVDAVPWSKTNPASFAGLHNKGSRIALIMDEASEIDDIIHETSEGALTDEATQILWIMFGNPTKVTGRFAKAFTNPRWHTTTVDARQSKFSNKRLIAQWAEDYGEDSDFFRVRVRGLPPRLGITNFIGVEVVEQARKRQVSIRDVAPYPHILSVDPGHFGDDESVVTHRQGPKVHRQWFYRGLDGPDLASRVVDTARNIGQIAACPVDAIGIGASCCDYLARVPDFPLIRVNVALPAANDLVYFNVRAELWGRMRDWLATAEIPDDDVLQEQLTGLDYGFDNKARFQLQSKKDLRALGRDSPDRADSLALSFIVDTVIRKPTVKAVALPKQRRSVVW